MRILFCIDCGDRTRHYLDDEGYWRCVHCGQLAVTMQPPGQQC